MSDQPSAIGNLAGLEAGQVLLPSFIGQRADGLYIDLLAIDSRQLIAQFVERVFAAGARFTGLDYDLFLKLLFLWQPADIDRYVDELKRKGKDHEVLLARGIVPFPQERREIYKAVKIVHGGKAAEYMFGPVSVEREIEDPQAPDGSGRRTVSERLYGDFDEFIAALWDKGVRFGIDAPLVRDAIARDKAERLTIAQFKAVTPGKDASVDEQTDLLHRDDAPRLLPDGRMDLCHFKNRFPQVSAGTRLFKKIARIDGISGWDVQGKELEPPAVKDFAIDTLAGVGTQVVKDDHGEYVVAARDGFIDIDTGSGKISVIEKVVGREGVSLRTTGNLSLAGAEYEEHGEVQERRVVEGHHMSFFADVFGNVLSDGGRIVMKRSASGGHIRSPNGEIVVEGPASRATFEAQGGSVTLNAAEGCTVIASRVVIDRAIRCNIVADEVEIKVSEGSAIATKKAVIKTSTARRDEATILLMLLPDQLSFDRQLNALAEARTEAEAKIEQQSAHLNELTGLPDMKTYLAIQPRLKAKTLTMSAPQQVQWQALLTRLTPVMRQVSALNADIQAAKRSIDEGEAERGVVLLARQEAMEGLGCAIESVAGETVVRSVKFSFEATPLAQLAPKDLHARLRDPTAGARLFAGASGSFTWQPAAAGTE